MSPPGRDPIAELSTAIEQLASTKTTPKQAKTVAALYLAIPPKRRPAAIREVRNRNASYWRAKTPRTSAYAIQVLEVALRDAAPDVRDAVLCACVGHNSGYIRENAALKMVDSNRANVAAGLLRAANDHVQQVRNAALRILSYYEPKDWAHWSQWLLSYEPLTTRSAWYELAMNSLRSEAGRDSLLQRAITTKAPEADAAFRLLRITHPTACINSAFLGADSWRVRAMAGEEAGKAGHYELSANFLTDLQPEVARRVTIGAAHSAPPARARIMWPALESASPGAARIAAFYLRDNPAALTSTLSRATTANKTQLAAIGALPIICPAEAVRVLTDLTRTASWRSRKAAWSALAANGLLRPEHLRALREEPDWRVCVHALRIAVSDSRTAAAGRNYFHLPTFAAQPGAARISTSGHVFSALPYALQAAAENWPYAENAVHRMVKRCSKTTTEGWQKPSPSQRKALEHATLLYDTRLPPWAEVLLTLVEEYVQ